MFRRRWIQFLMVFAAGMIVSGCTSHRVNQVQARLAAPIPIGEEKVPHNLPVSIGQIKGVSYEFPPEPELLPSPNKLHDVLALQNVLDSVERHYPLLLARLEQRTLARGQFLSSFGEFDLKLNGHGWANQGSYDNNRFRLGLEQAFGYQGIRTFGGYRRGRGSFPTYYGDRLTAQGGETFLGARFPLLRDRAIDPARAAVAKTQLGVELAEPDIAAARLQFLRLASRAYWNWTATARRHEIARRLLEIAEKRDEFLRKRLKAGAVAKIEIVDNQRTIVDRRTRLLLFRRAFEQASIELSLFVRDDEGNPLRPDYRWRAPDFPAPHKPNTQQLKADVDVAWQNRPELHALQIKREQFQVELTLAENQTLPNLDIVATGAQDIGPGKESLDRSTYEAGVLFEVPLQRRFAQGKILTLRGNLAQLGARERFVRDRIAAELQDAISALLRFYQMYDLAKQNVEVNRKMEEAELQKFNLGKSNMLFVNLRELARAEAEFQEVDALVRYHQAVADYYAALGFSSVKGTSPMAPGHQCQ